MSYEAFNSDVRFLSEQPPSLDCPADVFTLTPPFDDDPPPWEPRFEEISSPSSLCSRRPLDPPPPCFSTRSPLRIKSHAFPPFYIPAISEQLTDGFRVLYPHGILEKHGLNRVDWVRFLEDLGIAARLSAEGLSAVGSRVPVAPLLAHRIFPARILGAVYDARFARSPAEEVRALIQIWNQSAFERRKIRVMLQVRQIWTSEKKSYVLVVESL